MCVMLVIALVNNVIRVCSEVTTQSKGEPSKLISNRVNPRNNQETKKKEARNFTVARCHSNRLAQCLHPSVGFPFT